jgi:hypothetical protein
MSDETNLQKARNSRRQFLQSGGMALAGLSAASVAAPSRASTESLAAAGGTKTVTFPDERHSALIRWPRYGPDEKKALHELLFTGYFYEYVLLLVMVLLDYF